MSGEGNWQKHRDLLRDVSRSFFLSIKFLPEAMREPIALGYLLARLTDTIADSSDPPVLKRIETLQKLRSAENLDLSLFLDSISDEGEKKLLAVYPEILDWLNALTEEDQKPISKVWSTIIDGQIWDIEFFDPQGDVTDADTLRTYTYQVAGCVGEFWTEVGYSRLGNQFAEEKDLDLLMESGRNYGKGLQLLNIIRDLHEDIPAGRNYLPDNDIVHWLSQCESLLADGERYIKRLKNRRIQFATELPLLIARATIAEIKKVGPETALTRKIKISRAQVFRIIAKSFLAKFIR